MKRLLLALCCGTLAASAQTEENATLRLDRSHLGAGVELAGGCVLKADVYEKMWMQSQGMFSVGAFVRAHTLPSDSSAYAADYGYPTFSAGLLYGNYRGVRMHKDPAPDWGQAVPVSYVSRMGHTLTAFVNFERPLWRTPRWSVAYNLGTGIGYATHIYNKERNVDNEMLGSHWNIFFGAGLSATYQMAAHWTLRASLDFRHLSNGATARPNKGVNTLSPALSVVYTPELPALYVRPTARRPFPRRWYGSVALGVGGKTLLDDWLLTQYSTPPSSPEYRRGRFHFYPSYSLQANMMYRYARRWASGIGVDVNYAEAAHHIKALNRATGSTLRHSPWSMGIAARHEVFYGRLSMAASLGVYLFRRMGETAEWEERCYYERIGIRYHLPRLGGLYIGADVKAHGTKADFTEAVVGFEF